MVENAKSIFSSQYMKVLKNSVLFFLYTARFVKKIGIPEILFVTNVAVKGLLPPYFKESAL